MSEGNAGSSEGLRAELAKAYTAAWGEIGNVVKNSNNPHFGSDYADLAAVMDVVKPIFAKHGLALFQAPGRMEADKISLVGVLMHSSGGSITIDTQLPIGAKSTAQAAGSAITYARRYQAQAVAGIAPVDDDGNAASAEPPKRKQSKTEAAAAAPTYADTKAALIEKIESATYEALKETGEGSIREAVVELGDQEVVNVFTARRSELAKKK